MPRFRKKPVEVEAMQLPKALDNERALHVVARWCSGEVRWTHAVGGHDRHCIDIETLEGTMTALPGDWIIKGVQGEFYPCKPDIFAATYEPVDA